MEDFSSFGTPVEDAQPKGPDFSQGGTLIGDPSAPGTAFGMMGADPTTAGRAAQLSKQMGIPAPAIQADLPHYEELAKAQKNSSILAMSPILSQFLGERPDAANIAKDEIDRLATVESMRHGGDLVMAGLKGLAGTTVKAAQMVNMAVGGALTPFPDAQDWWFKNFVQPAEPMQQAATIGKNADFGEKAMHSAGGLLGMLSQIVLTGGEAAPGTAAQSMGQVLGQAVEHGVKSMAMPATSDMVNTMHDVYQNTGDLNKAIQAGQMQYATSTLGGIMPLSAPGGLMTRLAGGFASGATTGEVSRQAMNLVLPDSMKQQYDPDEMIMSGLTGALLGGVMGPRAEHNMAQAVRQTYVENARAEQAQADGTKLQTLSQIAAESKLREYDPAAFKEYIQRATEDTPLNAVYVDGKTLDAALHQSGVTAEELNAKMPEVARQLQDSRMAGGDVRIPVEDYATHLAGTDADKAILPELKTSPEGMTNREAQAYYQNAAETMQARIDQVSRQTGEDAALRHDLQQVHDSIQQQLDATGRFPKDVSGAYASLIREFYATQAERLNMTPSEVQAQHPLNITSEKLSGEALQQGQKPRGMFAPDSNTIALLKGADLTTFLHESGHFFFESLGRMASADHAPEQIKQDMQTVLNHLGEKDLDSWNAKSLEERREGHEKIAKSFERYLMEGKSPNLKMQGMFSRFRSWMLNVYRSLKGLNANLTPEVRGVFDRMLASEQSIHDAESARSYMPLFDTAEKAGMSREDFDAYKGLGEQATAAAVSEMQYKSLKDMQWLSNAKMKALKDLQKEHDQLRKETQHEATKEVAQDPIERAKLVLKTGKMIDAEGNEVPDTRPLGAPSFKLDKQALKEMYPKGALGNADLSKLRGMSGENGTHPDVLAGLLGFHDGHDLVRQLSEGPSTAEKIKALTDQRMLERHGELLDPESIERAANEAVHNEARARFMATGLKILTDSPLPAKEIARAAKEAADKMVAAQRVRDLNPRQYLSAETRANKDAVAQASKDPKNAVEAQRTALLNNRLARSAQDAQEDIRKGVDYLNKFNKNAVRNKIELQYRDQIDQLLEAHDLRKSVSGAELDKREALRDFVERQAALGLQTNIPQKLLEDANKTHYKDMSVEDFRGLVDSVRSIDQLGRLKEKLIQAQHAKDLASAVEEAKQSMAKLPQHEPDNDRGLTRIESKFLKLKSSARSMTSSLLKMEQICDWLDSRNPNGPMNTYVFRPIADAGHRANEMLLKASHAFNELAKSTMPDVTKDGNAIYTSPRLIDSKTGKAMQLTKMEMLDMAGHLGNESSWDKLTRGEKWNPDDARDFLMANMKKGDWDYVAGMGKIMESLWPEKLEENRKLGLTDPEKIQPRAFDTPHGSYDGWYWPMKYDPSRSREVEARMNRSSEEIFDTMYTRASIDTDTGRMNTRVENYAAPVLLGIDAIPRVVADEIHDIAYRRTIVGVDEFLKQAQVKDAITSALSKQHYDQFRPWLVSIANDGRIDNSNMRAMNWMNQIAKGARLRTTMVGLGYRVSTVLIHGSSAAMESLAELGPKWFGSGMKDFMNPSQWGANRDFVFDRSPEMANRMNEVDRDVRDHLRKIDLAMMNPALGALERGKLMMQGHAYHAIAMLDMASALPAWMGAYHKAMSPAEQGGLGLGEQDAIYFADKTVRNAHGGTGVKDLAAVQRGPELMKLFTMFYTFWNHNYNRLADTARMASQLPETYQSGDMQKFRGDMSSVILRSLIYVFGVQAMHSMLHKPKQGEEEEGWAKWAGKALLASSAGGIPVMRDVVPYLMGEKDYAVTPAASLVKAMHDSSMDVMNKINGEKVSDRWLKHTVTTAGYAFGLPTGQPASTMQFLHDVDSGQQNPQTMGDWWRGIVTGDMRKHQ